MVNISKLKETIQNLEKRAKENPPPPKKLRSLQLILDWAHEKNNLSMDEYNSLSQRLKKLYPAKKIIIESRKENILLPVVSKKTLLYIIPILFLFIVSGIFLVSRQETGSVQGTNVSQPDIQKAGKTLRFQFH